MKRYTVLFIIILCMLSSVCTADISYSLVLGSHTIIATGLDNGKNFLKVDGTLFQPTGIYKHTIAISPIPEWRIVSSGNSKHLFIWTSAGTKVAVEVLPTLQGRIFSTSSYFARKNNLQVEYVGNETQFRLLLNFLRRRSTKSCYN